MFTVLMDKHCTCQWNGIFSFRPQFTQPCFANFLFNSCHWSDRTILHKGLFYVTFVYHNHNVNPFGWDGVEKTSAYKTAVLKWKKMKSIGEVEHFDTHSVVMFGLFTSESLHKTCTSAFYLTMPNSSEGLSDREPKCLGGSSSHIFPQMFPTVSSQQPYEWMYYIH